MGVEYKRKLVENCSNSQPMWPTLTNPQNSFNTCFLYSVSWLKKVSVWGSKRNSIQSEVKYRYAVVPIDRFPLYSFKTVILLIITCYSSHNGHQGKKRIPPSGDTGIIKNLTRVLLSPTLSKSVKNSKYKMGTL